MTEGLAKGRTEGRLEGQEEKGIQVFLNLIGASISREEAQKLHTAFYNFRPGGSTVPASGLFSLCFRAIIEDREEPKCERVVDGYDG